MRRKAKFLMCTISMFLAYHYRARLFSTAQDTLTNVELTPHMSPGVRQGDIKEARGIEEVRIIVEELSNEEVRDIEEVLDIVEEWDIVEERNIVEERDIEDEQNRREMEPSSHMAQ